MDEIRLKAVKMSRDARNGISRFLVEKFYNDPEIKDHDAEWGAFQKAMLKMTTLTKQDLKSARKFITADKDDSRTDEVREEDIPKDRQEDQGDPDRKGNDSA